MKAPNSEFVLRQIYKQFMHLRHEVLTRTELPIEFRLEFSEIGHLLKGRILEIERVEWKRQKAERKLAAQEGIKK